jgi:hypothetical protein
MEAKKVKRLFNKAILLFLQQAQVMLNNFISDIALFTAKFPLKNAAYAAAMQTALDNADDAPDDDEVLSDQKQYTYAVEAAMEQGRVAYTTLIIYVKLAFPDDVAVLEHFGEHLYKAARRNQLKLKELIDLAYKRANDAEYKQPLIDEGFLQTDIDNLQTLGTLLETENLEQEDVKSGYLGKTQSRNELMNIVWNYMKEINLASKVVFIGNYAKLQQYLLYPERQGGNGGGDNPLTFSGTITDNETGALLAGATLEADGEVIATTNALGQFSITFTIEEPLTIQLTVKKTGYVDTETAQSFSPGVNETQDINMARIKLATYQQTVGAGAHSFGAFMVTATGLRITLLDGTAATVGLSNNGMSFVGFTETVDTIDEMVDRTVVELGGYAAQVLVQNNSAGDVEVRVDVLG